MEKFDLLGLTAQHQQVARGMILKEAGTFTTDDTEIGDFDTHKKMKFSQKTRSLHEKIITVL